MSDRSHLNARGHIEHVIIHAPKNDVLSIPPRKSSNDTSPSPEANESTMKRYARFPTVECDPPIEDLVNISGCRSPIDTCRMNLHVEVTGHGSSQTAMVNDVSTNSRLTLLKHCPRTLTPRRHAIKRLIWRPKSAHRTLSAALRTRTVADDIAESYRKHGNSTLWISKVTIMLPCLEMHAMRLTSLSLISSFHIPKLQKFGGFPLTNEHNWELLTFREIPPEKMIFWTCWKPCYQRLPSTYYDFLGRNNCVPIVSPLLQSTYYLLVPHIHAT